MPLQIFQETQSFHWAHVVDLQCADLLFDLVGAGFEEMDLYRGRRGARRELFDGPVFGFFVQREHFTRSFDDGYGESCETCYLDAIAAVRLAGFDFAQEDDPVARFFYRHPEVADSFQLFGKFGELVIVSREERFGARVGGDVFDNGPCERQAVIGRSSPPYLVEDDEASRGGRVEDHGGFGHFDHEG